MLLAEDRVIDAEIATLSGVTLRTLTRWKGDPAFRARIEHHKAVMAAVVEAEGISRRENRVRALNDRWQRMQRIIEQRAEDMGQPDENGYVIPGGDTGLLVRQTKSIGFGENNTVIEEYAVDVGLLRELRAHEEQSAKELGQWVDRSKLDVAVGDEIQKLAEEYGITPAEVRRDLAAILRGTI